MIYLLFWDLSPSLGCSYIVPCFYLYHPAQSVYITPECHKTRLQKNRTELQLQLACHLAAQVPIPLPGIPNKMTHGTATGFFHPRFRPDFYYAECSRCFLEPRANTRKFPFLLSFSLLSPFIPGKSSFPGLVFTSSLHVIDMDLQSLQVVDSGYVRS